MKYLSHNQINKQKWDACVEASTQRIVYALSWYLDVVAPGWAALVLEQGNQYKAVMPLPEARKFGIKYVFQPVFCQQLGIFSIIEDIDYSEFTSVFLQQYSYISNYNFNTENSKLLLFSFNQKLKVKQYYTHHLHLNHPYEDIYKNYSRDRKINLKRALKKNLTVKQSNDIEPLITMFKEDVARRINGGVSEYSYELLRQLYIKLNEKQMEFLYYTYTLDGEIDSGCLFIMYANKIIYLFSAASVKGRKNNGRTYIINLITKKFANKPYILDFESHPDNLAINHVYQGFGSEDTLYYQVSYNNFPKPLQVIKEARRLFYQQLLPAFQPKSKA